MAVTANFSFTLTDFDKIPWHTEEHNNWHNIDALLARYLAISNVQGVWENATAVTVSQRYIDSEDDTIWEVLVAHTTSSTSTFAAERAAKSTYWQSISVDASFAGTWAAGESYSVNQFVEDSQRYGVVTVAHTSVTSYNQGVSDGNITTLVDASTLVSTSPVATTLGAGSSATVAYNASTGVFTFGLPTGATGDTGATGSVEGTLSTRGDIVVRNASNVTARLAVGSANTVLKSDGSDVAYSTIATANVADDAITYAKIQNIGTANRVLGRASTGEVSEVQVATAMIADDAVSLAKIAAGTDGELITWDASGDPAVVGAGTSGHYLKSQGAGSVPVFASVSAAFTGPSTSVATTSGTSHDIITDIAAGTKVVIVNFENVSLNSGNNPYIQLGDEDGFETSGYVTCSFYQNAATSVQPTGNTSTWVMYAAGTGHNMNGQMIISLKEIDDPNYIYVQQHQCSLSTTQWIGGAGSKSLDKELTSLRIATAGGAFDNGSVSVIYF